MKRTEQSDLNIGHLTHPGEKRTNNEDNYAVVVFEPEGGASTNITLALVVDGIGGHQAGEVASGIAAQTIPEVFEQSDTLDYRELFTNAFALTGAAISAHATEHPESEGLGTTSVAVMIYDSRVYTAAIGDSRIYLLRDNKMRQISIDHSWVQEALDKGVLTKEEARNHPNRNVLRRHIGAGSDTTPDFRLRLYPNETDEESLQNQGMVFQPTDRLLLCSDGLTDMIDDPTVERVLQEQLDPQAATEELVQLAREAGGGDNITAVIVDGPKPNGNWLAQRSTWMLFLIGTLIVIGLVTIGVIGWFWYVNLTLAP